MAGWLAGTSFVSMRCAVLAGWKVLYNLLNNAIKVWRRRACRPRAAVCQSSLITLQFTKTGVVTLSVRSALESNNPKSNSKRNSRSKSKSKLADTAPSIVIPLETSSDIVVCVCVRVQWGGRVLGWTFWSFWSMVFWLIQRSASDIPSILPKPVCAIPSNPIHCVFAAGQHHSGTQICVCLCLLQNA